jgi:hypothetical protein
VRVKGWWWHKRNVRGLCALCFRNWSLPSLQVQHCAVAAAAQACCSASNVPLQAAAAQLGLRVQHSSSFNRIIVRKFLL